jgi:hypothetical protein
MIGNHSFFCFAPQAFKRQQACLPLYRWSRQQQAALQQQAVLLLLPSAS